MAYEKCDPQAADANRRDNVSPIYFQPSLTESRLDHPEYIQDAHDDHPDGEHAQPIRIPLHEAHQQQDEGDAAVPDRDEERQVAPPAAAPANIPRNPARNAVRPYH